MRIYFCQIYIDPGVTFPFSFHFQRRLAAEVGALVSPSTIFIKKYGVDWQLGFNISAKRQLQETEIRGPSVFRKEKDVEYTVFLPFGVIIQEADWPLRALNLLLKGIQSVLDILGIDTCRLIEQRASLIEGMCSDATMFDINRS